jgi:hypothetical protein
MIELTHILLVRFHPHPFGFWWQIPLIRVFAAQEDIFDFLLPAVSTIHPRAYLRNIGN